MDAQTSRKCKLERCVKEREKEQDKGSERRMEGKAKGKCRSVSKKSNISLFG